jgi:hypothetical protein
MRCGHPIDHLDVREENVDVAVWRSREHCSFGGKIPDMWGRTQKSWLNAHLNHSAVMTPGTWHSALEQTNEILVMSKLEDPSSESAAVGPFSAVHHKYHQFQQIR